MTLPAHRRSRRRTLLVLAVVLLLLGAAGIGVVATVSFTSVQVDRPVSANVVGEQRGYVQTNVTKCIPNRQREHLVTVTSKLNTTGQLTVTLSEPSIGTLHVDGQSGDTVRASIAPGDAVVVELEATARGPFPNEFTFDVQLSVSPLTFSKTHTARVDLPEPRGCQSDSPGQGGGA